jgi:hypothetical protein
MPGPGAQQKLITEYFRRYGPASVRDATWWSGLPQRAVFSALRAAEAIPVQTPWSSAVCYVLPEQLTDFEAWDSTPQAQPVVALLAHEDVALKAYFETRGRYLDFPGEPANR